MSRDNSPVRATCPIIDDVINFIKSNIIEDISQQEVDEAIEQMEDIRRANGTLREWGNDLYDENEDLQNDIFNLRQENDNLKYDLEHYENKVKELEKELNAKD